MFSLSHFAGQDVLFVGVLSTNAPCDEVLVKHDGRGQYSVNYKLNEQTRAFIFVKYGDSHVPGSPFIVDC
jgi:filamin